MLGLEVEIASLGFAVSDLPVLALEPLKPNTPKTLKTPETPRHRSPKLLKLLTHTARARRLMDRVGRAKP